MIKLLIPLVLCVGLFAQTQSAKSAKRSQVVDSQGENRNLNALGSSAKRSISPPFASTSCAFCATAQRNKLFSQVSDSKPGKSLDTTFLRLLRFLRFPPIPFPARSPSLHAFTNGGTASALRPSPPKSPLRARPLPLRFVAVVPSPSPTTKQLSEREREERGSDA